MTANQLKMTEDFIPRLAALGGGGAYLNEGDFRQPNFESTFYGGNYETLRQIKRKYDPFDIFWGVTAVGSEGWYVDELKAGRLCRRVK